MFQRISVAFQEFTRDLGAFQVCSGDLQWVNGARGVPKAFQGCFSSVPVILKGFQRVPGTFQESFKSFRGFQMHSMGLQWCSSGIQGVSGAFSGGLMDVS